jgi:hypothetical protein
MRIVQLSHQNRGRVIAIVEGSTLLLTDLGSVREMALTGRRPVPRGESIEYGPIYRGESAEWKLLPAADHPMEPACCMISGTGLTHLKSAQNRNAMHEGPVTVTDSMKMYQWGVDGGKPAGGGIGAQPEWFYKGTGSILRAHGEPLEVPAYADDGGDEAEIAAVYVIDAAGVPRRVGFAMGNEFSDHVMERKNYLYLAHSKLRTCSLGPELVLTQDFTSIRGKASVERSGQTIWSANLHTGEAAMSHSLENLEHHHFKYAAHCRPGDVHIHYFGAGAFSFGEGVALQDGDEMIVAFDGMGEPLRNPVRIDRSSPALAKVVPLEFAQ